MLPLPHLNPQISHEFRFRLRIQVERVQKICDSERLCRWLSHFPSEIRRCTQECPYGWMVAKTTIHNLFRKYKIDWDDEDDEKLDSGCERARLSPVLNSFWIDYLRPRPEPVKKKPWWDDPRMYDNGLGF